MTMTTTATEVRLGVIGAGRIAVQHLDVLQAVPGAHVVGITSRTRSRADDLAARYRIDGVFDSPDEMVGKARPDALLVLVSAGAICDVTHAAIGHGLPLFIEKPAGLTPAETERLAQYAKFRGVATMVGYNRRYYSIFREGLEIIRRHGPLMAVMIEGHERIAAVRATGRHPDAVLAGWLYANGTHTVDLLRFFGGEVTQAHCLAHRYEEPLGDQFAAIMEFDSGAMGEYSSHWLSPGGWRATLCGRGVTVEFKPLEAGRWTDAAGKVHEIAPSEQDRRFKPGFYGQMEAFCNLARGGAPAWPLQDLEGAHRTMRLAERMAAGVTTRAAGAGA